MGPGWYFPQYPQAGQAMAYCGLENQHTLAMYSRSSTDSAGTEEGGRGGSIHLSEPLEPDSSSPVAVAGFEESSYTLDMRRHICLHPLFMAHISILGAAEH